MRVLFSLGKEHADTFGEWAKERVGVNPINLFKEVYGEFTNVESAAKFVGLLLVSRNAGMIAHVIRLLS
jgi:hypothetical protein